MAKEYLPKDLPNGFVYDSGLNLIVPDRKTANPVITIAGHIDENLVESICQKLTDLKTKSLSENLDINLSSFGGSVYYGFAIHDLLTVFKSQKKVDIRITAYGPVQSMGVLILQSGSIRKMSENAEMLIHPFTKEPKNPVFVDTLKADVEQLEKMNLRYYEVIAKRIQASGGSLSSDEVKEMALAKQNSGTYLSATEALKYKLIDEIA